MSTALFLTGLLAALASANAPSCTSDKFSDISVKGIEVLLVNVEPVTGFAEWSASLPHTFVPLPVPEDKKTIDFCNVSVTYTHPGLNDVAHAYVWLPADDGDWNGRLLGEGGGGWAAALENGLGQAVAMGYAAAQTDGGHDMFQGPYGWVVPDFWAAPKGNVDWIALQNFISQTLDDLPKIAKQVVKGFYGKEAKKAYWHGCSTGGRQGLMSVQRYPENYDGVLSVAPAINWATFLVTEIWPQLLMKREGYYPSQCEFAAIHQAAMEACDKLDGVQDGLMSAVPLCTYDATKAVGKVFDCEGGISGKVSKAAANIANKIWEGPKKDGRPVWYGNTHDMPFGGPGPFDGLASTACDDNGKNCKPAPFVMSESWIQVFLAKDRTFDVASMTDEEFFRFLALSKNQFESIMSTNDPDVSSFKAKGGKVILWHGLADQVIFPNGSTNYYERVEALDPDVRSFFRYFQVPGLAHCLGGPGAQPVGGLQSLVDWVEEGIAPDTLEGVTGTKERIYCVYPLVAAYKGGDPDKKSSYECAPSFDKFKANWDEGHSEL